MVCSLPKPVKVEESTHRTIWAVVILARRSLLIVIISTSAGGSVVECSLAMWATRVQFPASAFLFLFVCFFVFYTVKIHYVSSSILSHAKYNKSREGNCRMITLISPWSTGNYFYRLKIIMDQGVRSIRARDVHLNGQFGSDPLV